jgi:hypothetical protein
VRNRFPALRAITATVIRRPLWTPTQRTKILRLDQAPWMYPAELIPMSHCRAAMDRRLVDHELVLLFPLMA